MKSLKSKALLLGIASTLTLAVGTYQPIYADEAKSDQTTQISSDVAFQVSPMNQKITLTPGERYYGTFRVTNPGTSKYSFHYKTDVGPFYVDDQYSPVYENNGDYNQMVDWITVIDDNAIIAPNDTATIRFYVDVPENAPAGGQYASITVSSDTATDETGEGIALHAKYAIAHLVYAEVAGETIRKGDINNVVLPGFLFSGQIAGTATIKNEGNVHSDASYTLQVFPLFSNEEVYTNEEEPMTNTIMPGTARTTTLSWADTPSVGIFHVIYKASFEGVENKIDKIVFICPLWLLFLIAVAIFLVIIRIVTKKKKE